MIRLKKVTIYKYKCIENAQAWVYAIIAERSIQSNPGFRRLIDTRSRLEVLLDEQ